MLVLALRRWCDVRVLVVASCDVFGQFMYCVVIDSPRTTSRASFSWTRLMPSEAEDSRKAHQVRPRPVVGVSVCHVTHNAFVSPHGD